MFFLEFYGFTKVLRVCRFTTEACILKMGENWKGVFDEKCESLTHDLLCLKQTLNQMS